MIRRQHDDYGQNKIIHIHGSKGNLLFIVNHMVSIQKKKLSTQPLCRERVYLTEIKIGLATGYRGALGTIREICDLAL